MQFIRQITLAMHRLWKHKLHQSHKTPASRTSQLAWCSVHAKTQSKQGWRLRISLCMAEPRSQAAKQGSSRRWSVHSSNMNGSLSSIASIASGLWTKAWRPPCWLWTLANWLLRMCSVWMPPTWSTSCHYLWSPTLPSTRQLSWRMDRKFTYIACLTHIHHYDSLSLPVRIYSCYKYTCIYIYIYICIYRPYI